MDTRQLAAFCAVVERESFSQAAQRLGVTQPAVSQQIRALEQRVGKQLLDRSGRRVVPTEAGLRLYRGAQRMLAVEEQLLEDVAASEDGALRGRLAIGASTGPGANVLTRLLCAFQEGNRDVTVALSGDGGDELFCGYRRYFEALEGFFPSKVEGGIRNTMSRLRFVPASVRRALAQSTGLAGRLPLGRLARMFSRASEVFNETSPHCRYLRNLSHWRDLENIVVGLSQPGDSSRRGPWEERGKRSEASGLSPSSDSPRLTPREPTGVTFGFPGRVSSPCWESAMRELIACSDQVPASPEEFQQAWQVYDTLNYLPGDILTKVDRASMGISLEARTPLLDHRVVEFAWSLPHSFKVQGRTGKRILQDLLARYVPRELFVRPKVGFGIPIGEWLRGPLRDWAEHLLDEHRLKREGFFHPQPVRQKWEEHLRGRADWGFLLWDILMFQAWFANR